MLIHQCFDATGSGVCTTGGAEPIAKGKPANLARYICELVGANPDGCYVEVDMEGQTRSSTYRALFRQSLSIAQHLADRPGDAPLILCFSKVAHYIPAAWGCMLAGRDFMPLSPALLYRDRAYFAEQLAGKAGLLRAAVVLSRGDTAQLLAVALEGQQGGLAVLDTASMEDGALTPFDPPGRHATTASIFIETSGSTGTAKIARLGAAALINRFFDGVGPDNRVTLNVLASHSIGGIRLLLPVGWRNVFLNPARMMVNPQSWFDVISTHGVTRAGLTCSMASRLTKHLEDGGSCDATSLKWLAFGAEPILPTVARPFFSRLSECGMRDAMVSFVYSMTETGPVFTSTKPVASVVRSDAESGDGYRFDRCSASWSVRIRRDDGTLANKGESGVIEVHSATRLFAGYHPGGGGIGADGWFSTGDRGALDETGLRLTGREKNTVIVHGRKVTCEEIEARIAALPGLERTPVAAAAYREEGAETDRLAVFLALASSDDVALRTLLPRLRASVSRSFGLAIDAVVPIREEDVPRTSTGKILRRELAEGLVCGRLRPLAPAPLPRDTTPGGCSAGANGKLAQIWAAALELQSMPDPNSDFFDSGGDSLAMMDLLLGVEQAFGHRVSPDAFFENPTLAGLRLLVEGVAAPHGIRPVVNPVSPRTLVVRKHQILSEAWAGERPFRNSLIVARNAEGAGDPIFWVFQRERELDALAAALGPDQPLYGMRSLVGVVPTAAYPAHHGDIGQRLARQIRGLLRGRPFVLGGNCQGAIIALGVARRLARAGQEPRMLVLMEWSFSYGGYAGPTLLLYGADSFTAVLFRDPEQIGRWRNDFPQARVSELAGRHGSFFSRQHVGELARTLVRYAAAGGPIATLGELGHPRR